MGENEGGRVRDYRQGCCVCERERVWKSVDFVLTDLEQDIAALDSLAGHFVAGHRT